MKIKFLFIIIAAVSTSACSFNIGGAKTATETGSAANASNTAANAAKTPESGPASTAAAKAPIECGQPKQAGKRFIKSQSFPFDFKPFEGGCFVTFGSVEDMLDEKDLPRGSTFYIYKDGKQVFEFPDGFGGQPACWLAGVSFKDLNGDGLTDVIMAGACLAARDSYPVNAIYKNTGSTFTTKEDANAELGELTSLKDIEAFAKKNLKMFF